MSEGLSDAAEGSSFREVGGDYYDPTAGANEANLAKAKELGFEIEADVNPMMFERMGINASFFHGPLDLSFFTELQVDILRLDLGLNDMEEAFLSKNKEGDQDLRERLQHSGSCGSCTGCRR